MNPSDQIKDDRSLSRPSVADERSASTRKSGSDEEHNDSKGNRTVATPTPTPGRKRQRAGFAGNQFVTAEDELEYKRLKNRQAARNFRERQRIIQEELQQTVLSLTKEHTKLITERYQMETKLSSVESANESLKGEIKILETKLAKAVDLLSKHTSNPNRKQIEEDLLK